LHWVGRLCANGFFGCAFVAWWFLLQWFRGFSDVLWWLGGFSDVFLWLGSFFCGALVFFLF
jgi:hypothetical protein